MAEIKVPQLDHAQVMKLADDRHLLIHGPWAAGPSADETISTVVGVLIDGVNQALVQLADELARATTDRQQARAEIASPT